MQLDMNLAVINIALLICLFTITVGYTLVRRGQTHGWVGFFRYGMFGVASFIFAGMLIIGYLVWLYMSMGVFTWIQPIGEQEFELANGFITVLVGASVGLFLGILAYIKSKEMYMR